MAAVVAAIGAAFLAGAIALFRERRQEQRRFVVAARVTHATFRVASQAIKTALDMNRWPIFNAMPGEDSFANAWESYKGDLAGHLSWEEWRKVEDAVSRYLALLSMSQDNPPQEAGKVLSNVRDALVEGRKILQRHCE